MRLKLLFPISSLAPASVCVQPRTSVPFCLKYQRQRRHVNISVIPKIHEEDTGRVKQCGEEVIKLRQRETERGCFFFLYSSEKAVCLCLWRTIEGGKLEALNAERRDRKMAGKFKKGRRGLPREGNAYIVRAELRQTDRRAGRFSAGSLSPVSAV